MLPGVAPPSGRGDFHLEGGFSFNFEATIKSAANVVRIKKRALANLVNREVSTRLPFAECPQGGAGFFAGEYGRNGFSGPE